MSTQNVNVTRFARNVEWDFFCDFQTLCSYWLLLVVKRGMVNGKSFPDVRDPKDAAVGSGPRLASWVKRLLHSELHKLLSSLVSSQSKNHPQCAFHFRLLLYCFLAIQLLQNLLYLIFLFHYFLGWPECLAHFSTYTKVK